MLVTSFRLDERAIMFGRTGKWPDDSSVGTEPKVKKPLTTPSNSLDLNSGGQRLDSKSPTYALLSGESLRSLSPAEQVRHQTNFLFLLSLCSYLFFVVPAINTAFRWSISCTLDRFLLKRKSIINCSIWDLQVAHQLLNGRPTVKGLRRQFSLDQGSNSQAAASRPTFRKAPSLEEASETMTSPSEKLNPKLIGSSSEANVKASSAGSGFEVSQLDTSTDSTNKIKTSPRPQKPFTASKAALSVVEESPVLHRKLESGASNVR